MIDFAKWLKKVEWKPFKDQSKVYFRKGDLMDKVSRMTENELLEMRKYFIAEKVKAGR